MAVIEDGEELLCVAGEMANARFAADGVRPGKVLMSQRQYDALCRWYRIATGEDGGPESMWVQYPWGTRDYIPIVICPDCDLYLSSAISPLPR